MIVVGSAVPILASVGVGIDVARMVNAKAALHNATDAAALAGATLYTSAANASAASSGAQTYFSNYAVSPGMSVGTPTVTTTGAGTAASPYTVTVTATATLPTSLMQIAGVSKMTVSSSSTAAIQARQTLTLQPIITAAPGTGSSSQFASGVVNGSSAWDWNSAYMYGLNKNKDGSYDYNTIPPIASMYEVGSNCGVIDGSFMPGAPCLAQPRAIPPTTQTFVVDPDQPLAFLFLNMNNGVRAPGNGYGGNQWGSQPGWLQIMTTASMASLQGPAFITDQSVTNLNKIGYNLVQGATHYSTVNNSINNNCALQIQLVTDMNNIPTNPPHPGKCYPVGVNDGGTGSQYANLSCNQIGNQTFMYWWNDMGATVDDYDYKNLYYLVSCRQGTNNPDGGTIGKATLPPAQPPAPIAKLL